MPRVFVGIGSNVNRDASIRSGVQALREVFGALTISDVYQSPAVGFEGDDFYNLVVAFNTERGAPEVARTLHDIEWRFGRDRAAPKYSSRSLDLDLLLYDDLVVLEKDLELPRADIGMYAFVLRPLAEIAGDCRHPVSGQRFADMWSGFEQRGQALRRVRLKFEDPISRNTAER